jgi:hypothetical protein
MATSTSPGHQALAASASPRYLTLHENASDEAKHLVELRCRMKDDKGKGMWDNIKQAHDERFGSKTKENLQMQLIRVIQSHAVWPEEEVS